MLLFESFNEIEAICQKYKIKNYTINSDGTIDVNGDVKFYPGSIKAKSGLGKLPLKFREVTGDFSCCGNDLTTLEGAPQSVGGNFNCSENKLTILEGRPQSVDGDFHCNYNNLTTLKGAPQSVSGHFHCNYNNLTTLEGSPKSVGGLFDCGYNELTTLVGAPKSLVGWFYCYNNPLDSIRKLFPTGTTFYKLSMEWEFFAGGNKIYKHRFLEAMLDINKELPESIPGYEYI